MMPEPSRVSQEPGRAQAFVAHAKTAVRHRKTSIKVLRGAMGLSEFTGQMTGQTALHGGLAPPSKPVLPTARAVMDALCQDVQTTEVQVEQEVKENSNSYQNPSHNRVHVLLEQLVDSRRRLRDFMLVSTRIAEEAFWNERGVPRVDRNMIIQGQYDLTNMSAPYICQQQGLETLIQSKDTAEARNDVLQAELNQLRADYNYLRTEYTSTYNSYQEAYDGWSKEGQENADTRAKMSTVVHAHQKLQAEAVSTGKARDVLQRQLEEQEEKGQLERACLQQKILDAQEEADAEVTRRIQRHLACHNPLTDLNNPDQRIRQAQQHRLLQACLDSMMGEVADSSSSDSASRSAASRLSTLIRGLLQACVDSMTGEVETTTDPSGDSRATSRLSNIMGLPSHTVPVPYVVAEEVSACKIVSAASPTHGGITTQPRRPPPGLEAPTPPHIRSLKDYAEANLSHIPIPVTHAWAPTAAAAGVPSGTTAGGVVGDPLVTEPAVLKQESAMETDVAKPLDDLYESLSSSEDSDIDLGLDQDEFGDDQA